jgi:DNA invertase Pin-like site-specific DNA recombinase
MSMKEVTEQGSLVPAVLYAAKSTQDRHRSIPAQLEDCRRMAAEKGWTVVGEYQDEGFSAYSRSRGPGLAAARKHAARAAAESGTTAMLVAQHPDRFSRGAGDKPGAPEALIEIWHAERRRDVHLRSVQDDFDLSTSGTVANMGERNYSDSKRKATATADGKRRTAEEGKWQGPVPDGYRIERTPEGTDIARRVELDPERQEVYRLIWDLAIDNATVNTIVRELAARGYLTAPSPRRGKPRPWTTDRVQKVLRNPFYAGLHVHKGAVVSSSNWPAYVEPDNFERLRRERSERRRPSSPTGRPSLGLLAGLARCDNCGAAAVHHTGSPRKDGTRRRSYICETVKRRPGVVDGCSVLPYDADAFERLALDGIDDLLGTSGALAKALTASQDGLRGRLTSEAAADERETADADAAIDALSEGYQSALLAGDESGLEACRRRLDAERKARQDACDRWKSHTDALAALEHEPEETADLTLARLCEKLSDRLSAASGDIRAVNGVLREHFASLHLALDDGQLSITPVLNAAAIEDLRRENEAATHRTSGELIAWSHWRYDRDPADPEHWSLTPEAPILVSAENSASSKKFGFST